jgi:asparagine synthetase B (glutamine-hydrolysing)
LSGGFDSRVLLGVLDKSDLQAFTYGRLGSDDLRFARRAARTAGVKHTAIEIEPDYLVRYASPGIQRLEDLLNCDQYHGISAYDQIAGQVQALIAGSAGEDVLGYIERDPDSEAWSSGFSQDRLYRSFALTTDCELEALVAPAYAGQLVGLASARFRHDFGRYQSRHPPHRHAYWCMRYQQRRLYNRLSSLFPARLLFRPLYLDNDVVDLGQQLPLRLRWGRKSLYGRVLQRTAPELARLPLTTTGGLPLAATPDQIGRRKRRQRRWNRWQGRASRLSKGLLPLPGQVHAYADYATWFRRELRPWAESILLAPRTAERGYWRPAAIKSLLQDHVQGKGRRSAKTIAALISLELWHRIYLDGDQGKGVS